MSTTNCALTLRITDPDGNVRESRLAQDNLILGSGPTAAVQLFGPRVSAMHLMLKVEQSGAVKVIDLGSEHGTRLGNEVIRQPTTLASGDVLDVGGSRVQVIFGPDAPDVVEVADAAPEPTPPGRNGFDFGHNQVDLPSAWTAAPNAPAKAPVTAPAIAPALPEAPAAQVPASAQILTSEARLNLRTPFPIHGALDAAPPTQGKHALQVAVAWGDQLLGVQHYGDGFPVTIGEGRDNEFHVFSAAVGAKHTLAVSKDGKLSLNVPAGAQVEVYGGARPSGAAATAQPKTIELSLHQKARVDVENVSFLLRHVTPAEAVAVKQLGDRDFTFFKVASICGLLGIAALIALLVVPRPDGSLAEGIQDSDQAEIVRLLVKPKKEFVPAVQPSKKNTEKSGAEEGEKAKEEEGKFGKETAEKQEADPSKKGSPVVDPNKKEKDRKKVMSSGLLGARGNAASDVLGPGGLGSGINSSLGGLKGGAGIGDAKGVGGLGSRGSGPGGGGQGLGLGGLGTKGTGRGSGGSGLEMGGKGHETVKVIPGKTLVVGGLSKEVIARVIRQHQQEIKYCYESELQRSPNLSGKVAVAWVIGPDGSVTKANVSESTMGNAAVERCMVTRIKRWRFPEVPGGGVVDVTFPWVFKPAGAGAP